MGFRGTRLRGPKGTKVDCMAHPTTNISNKTLEKLKELGLATKTPVGRLIAIAIDNEFEQPEPFRYDLKRLAASDPIEDNSEEAQKIYTYIMGSFQTGISYCLLMICRLDFGVSDKTRVMVGLDELIRKKIMMEVESLSPWTKGELLIKPAKDVIRHDKKQRKYKELEKLTKATLEKGVLHSVKR
jgi:hypothetical protein